jgi:hypothetical protein
MGLMVLLTHLHTFFNFFRTLTPSCCRRLSPLALTYRGRLNHMVAARSR